MQYDVKSRINWSIRKIAINGRENIALRTFFERNEKKTINAIKPQRMLEYIPSDNPYVAMVMKYAQCIVCSVRKLIDFKWDFCRFCHCGMEFCVDGMLSDKR